MKVGDNSMKQFLLEGGGDLVYDPDFILPNEAKIYLNSLITQVVWEQKSSIIKGVSYKQPRLVAWYGDPGTTYTYSGSRNDPLNWIPLLLGLKERVERALNVVFNSVLANYYRNGNDSIGSHSDNEKELGDDPIIASLSFGSTRTFELKYCDKKKNIPDIQLELSAGSLLVMRGTTQKFWKHSIPKNLSVKEPRVNLTFRKINLTQLGILV